ncbi:S9 family peptidase [Halorubellus sp. PRR65]|uniref:S9 family peptidase n=1 Tax=Halorubellus sp. PRR65 TaxID=3098148 RepID=UPI002B263DA5|nr:S9 family peptidase [Halorubellus sp. PRR65]
MRTVDAEDYLELATPSDPRVSPDGERVAFVRRTARVDDRELGTDADACDEGEDARSVDGEGDGEMDATDVREVEASVYVVDLGGGEPRRFTAAAGVDSEPRWSPSGDRIAFATDRGEERPPDVWVLPVDGGEARRVTNVPGGVSALAWGPDGDRVAFLQSTTAGERERGDDLAVDDDYEREDPDPRVVDRTVYRAAQSYTDGTRSHVYVADLTADDAVTRVTDGAVDHTAPAWGDDGALYFGARDPADDAADPDDTTEFALRRRGPDGGVETLVRDTSWAPRLAVADDGRVAYASTPEDRSTLRQADVHLYDPDTGDVRVPTADLDRTIEGDAPLQFGPGDESVYVLTPETGSVVVRRVPVAPAGADAPPDAAPTVVVGEDAHCSGFDASADVLAFAASEWDHPGDVFAATPRGAEQTRLSTLNRDYLDERAVVQPEALSFPAGDASALRPDDGAASDDGNETRAVASVDADRVADAAVQGWLFTPPELGPEESAPLVVEVHGGPHATWTGSGTMWHEFQTLAAAGFCVFACNPRGSTGYGEAFQAAIERDWGAVTAADVLAGVDRVTERDAVDDDELFLAGGSFGGYMTAWLLAHTDRFDAGVPQRGVYDLVSFYGSTDGAYKLVEDDFGETPWTDPEFLAAHSPAMAADAIDAPTLVVHAEDDYRVPIGGAELLYRGLRKNGTPTRLVRYPREGHELSRSGEPGHVVDRIERIRDWFRGYSDAFELDEPL